MAEKKERKKPEPKSKEPKQTREIKPATSPEAREQQLINAAVDLAERQLRDGTAAPSVINHFLKMASKREVIEREILERQKTLIEAKAENIKKDSENEAMAKKALEAMKSYQSSSR
jgi:hypothetical protein